MKYIDKYSKEELLDQLNTTRKALMSVCENIYKFLGNNITNSQLLEVTSAILSDSEKNRLYHLYIKKDYINNFLDDIESDYVEDNDLSFINEGI